MMFLKKLAPLAVLAALFTPALAFADQDVRSCCILSEGTRVTSCYQFTDAVLGSNPAEADLNIVRQHQQYKCQNIPYLYEDRSGETARYVANDTSNSGVCGTALSASCNSQTGLAIPLSTVHAKCVTAADCGSSPVYVCETGLCKIKEGQGCIGSDGSSVNCASGLVCRTTDNGNKCLGANAGTSTDDAFNVANGEADIVPFAPVIPHLSVPIPGFSFTSATQVEGDIYVPYLSEYVNAIYRYMTAIVLTIAIVMIVYGGFRYLLASTPLAVKDGKTIITDAIVGMVLVLGSYVILNTINPSLLLFQPLKLYRVDPEQYEYVSPADLVALAAQSSYRGSVPANNSAAVQQAIEVGRVVARERGIDECFMVATIQSESGGRFAAIGHDENVTRVSTRARAAFQRRGRTYLGRPVGERTTNDDVMDPSKPDFGLDMEMSHGLGLGQVTIGKVMCRGAETCDLYQCEKNGQLVYGAKLADGVCYSVPDLLTLEGGVRAMSNYLVSKLRAANGNVARARALYVGYANSPNWETDSRTVNFMSRYNACRGGR